MDYQQQYRKLLETIREESEERDEIEGSKEREEEEEEEEEEDFNFQVGVESEEVMAQEESEEDDAPPLRVLRPRRMSRYLRQESFPQIQSTNEPQEEMENFSESDRMTHAEDLSAAATPPQQERLGNERRSSSGELRRKVSKVRGQKSKPPEAPVQKKTNRRRGKKLPTVEPFPDWLVSLMINIEEATTHQLVVE